MKKLLILSICGLIAIVWAESVTVESAARSVIGNSSVVAQRCIEDGRRFDSLAKIESEESPRLFDQALNSYLCAAREASAEGALLAASISLSGMARRLSEDSLISLYMISIDSGNYGGYVAVSDLFCGEGGFGNCTHKPERSIANLKIARKLGVDVSFEMAQLLREPSFPGSDSSRAFACNKFIGGKKWLQIRNAYLARSPSLDTSVACEFRP